MSAWPGFIDRIDATLTSCSKLLSTPFSSAPSAECSVKHDKLDPPRRGLLCLLAIGLIAFLLAQYLPLSGKAQNNVAYVLVLLPSLFMVALFRGALTRSLRWTAPFLVFLAGVVIADLVGVRGAFLKASAYLFLFSSGVFLLALYRPIYLVAGYAIFAIASLLVLSLAAWDWLVILVSSGVWSRETFSGSAENPIYAGLLVASGLMFLVYFSAEDGLIRHSRKHLILIFTGLALSVLATVVFQSRSALLGLALSVLVYGLIIGKWRTLALLVGVSAIAVFATGLHEAILNRGLSYRPEIWRDLLQKWWLDCNLLSGCSRTDEVFIGQFFGSHSGYFGTLYRHGLLGLAGLLFFLAWYVVQGIKSKSRWFLVSLIGWGGMLTAMDGFVGSPAPWWLFVWLPTIAAIADFYNATLQQGTNRREQPAF